MTPIEVVPRIASILFGKTHKWVLLARVDEKLLYAARNAEVRVGEQATIEELFRLIAERRAAQWSLSALSEPALTETEAPKALDFLYPLDVAHFATAVTPQRFIQALINYFCRAAAVIGMPFRYRGFPDLAPTQDIQLRENAEDVSINGMLLCGEMSKPHKCYDLDGLPDKHLWASRALQELFPCAYYQKISSRTGGAFLYYVVGALEGLAAAKEVWDIELAEINDRRKIGTHMEDNAFLCRNIGATAEDGYYDQTLSASTLKANKTLSELKRKLMIIASRPSPMRLVDPDITLEAPEIKKEILRLHNNDALAPITALAWEAL